MMKSPTWNGLSMKIANELNASPSTDWAARATATPPMPRLATNAVILTPRLSKIKRSVAAQIRNRATQVMFLSIAALVGSSFAVCSVHLRMP